MTYFKKGRKAKHVICHYKKDNISQMNVIIVAQYLIKRIKLEIIFLLNVYLLDLHKNISKTESLFHVVKNVISNYHSMKMNLGIVLVLQTLKIKKQN